MNNPPESGSEATQERRLSTEAFGLLSDPYVRFVCQCLHDSSGPIAAEDLADLVVGLAASHEGTVATMDDRDRVLVRLHHATLPKLDDAGYLEFDPIEHVVVEVSIPQDVYSLLEELN